MYQWIPYLWLTLFLFGLMLGLMIHALKNRSVSGAGFFLLTLVLVELWIVAQGLELSAAQLQTKLLWANIQYIPILLIPIVYLLLTLKLTGQTLNPKQKNLFLLLLIAPAVMQLVLWTGDPHELVRQNVTLNLSGPFPTVDKSFGPLLWVFAAQNYLVGFLTFLLLFRAYRAKSLLERKRFLPLLIALLLPYCANFVHISGLNPLPVDCTPAVFGLSALIIAFGIFRYRLLSIVPIAHSIIISQMSTGLVIISEEGTVLEMNTAAREMLSLLKDTGVGQSVGALSEIPELRELCSEDAEAIREIAFEQKDQFRYYEVCCQKIFDKKNRSIGRLIQIYNITERKNAEQEASHAALHDPLTGLMNRKGFQAQVSKSLIYALSSGDRVALGFLDLNDFKRVNDTWGHDAGDRVLCLTAERLRESLRESDLVSRIGGDEFVLALMHVGDPEILLQLGRKVSKAVEQSISWEGSVIQVKASLGFAVFPKDGLRFEELLKKADAAMYAAKNEKAQSSRSCQG